MKIKSITALLVLALCVTIGGVYATWTYAGTDDVADVYYESKVTIADTELSGANGKYTVESNLVLTIDDTNNDHVAELIFGSNNDQPVYLKITFCPEDYATPDIKLNGVPSELYFTTTTPMQFRVDEDGNYDASADPVDIFRFSNPGNGVLDNTFEWVKEDDGTFTYTLGLTDLQDMIELSQTFILDEKTEHDLFRQALNGNLLVRVTDGTVN